MALRPRSSRLGQRAISSIVRQQPSHSRVASFRQQMPMQGEPLVVSIGMAGTLFTRCIVPANYTTEPSSSTCERHERVAAVGDAAFEVAEGVKMPFDQRTQTIHCIDAFGGLLCWTPENGSRPSGPSPLEDDELVAVG